MRSKNYLTVTGIIFSLITCLHLARLLLGWHFQIGTWIVPYWFSWGGILGAGALSIWAFRLILRRLRTY
jgi:hypothetical protein